MRRRPAALALVLAASLGGLVACGGKEGTLGQDTDAPEAQERADDTPTVPRGGVPGLPPQVPSRAQEGVEAPATDRRIINAWARALREGDVERAADYFAEPSRIQNGTPVVTLDDARERLAFNDSLPCGSKAVDFGFARGYVIVEVELTERVGGDCQGAAGARARVAIRVADRKITDWYRLADDADATPPATPTPPVPIDPDGIDTV